MTAPYTLGVFTGNPGDANAVAQDANLATLIGEQIAIKNTYMDGTVNPDTWEGSVGYWAGEFKANAPWNVAGVIPMIGMPMNSSDTTYSETQILQRYINGTYDGYLQAIITEWYAAGYKTLICRPGVEMNSIAALTGSAAMQELWVQAFQHIYTVLHTQAQETGTSLKVVWNPNLYNGPDNATATLYPGNDYCDLIGGDFYADLYPSNGQTVAEIAASPAFLTEYFENVGFSIPDLAAFARKQGKPLCVPECGGGGSAPSDNPTFWTWLRSALDAHVEAGGTVDHVSMWNANAPNPYQITGGQQPLAMAAIKTAFGIGAASIPSATPAVTPSAPVAQSFTVSPPMQVGTSGVITDTAGTQWQINAGQKIEYTPLGGSLTVEETSSDVETLYWTGSVLDQLNTSGDWWSQPLSGGAGTELTEAPAGYIAPTSTPAAPTSSCGSCNPYGSPRSGLCPSIGGRDTNPSPRHPDQRWRGKPLDAADLRRPNLPQRQGGLDLAQCRLHPMDRDGIGAEEPEGRVVDAAA